MTDLRVLRIKIDRRISFRVKKKIENDDKTKYNTFYSRSKTETIINKRDIDDVFELIYATIIKKCYLDKHVNFFILSIF